MEIIVVFQPLVMHVIALAVSIEHPEQFHHKLIDV